MTILGTIMTKVSLFICTQSGSDPPSVDPRQQHQKKSVPSTERRERWKMRGGAGSGRRLIRICSNGSFRGSFRAKWRPLLHRFAWFETAPEPQSQERLCAHIHKLRHSQNQAEPGSALRTCAPSIRSATKHSDHSNIWWSVRLLECS